MDPFFKMQKSGRAGGLHNSYMEDISRTYGKNISGLAPRKSGTYEKALQYRQKEKDHYASLEQRLRDVTYYGVAQSKLHDATLVELDSLREKLSKLEAEHERATTRRDDRTADGGVRVQPEQLEQPREERPLHGEVLPADGVPDPRGQASEHGDEGRRTGGDDTAGSVEQRDEAVPEGGD